jgi:membrane protein required for colicin V production
MRMNWLDSILVFILIVTTIVGIIKGFLRQAFSILALIIGLVLALNFYSRLSWIYLRLTSNVLLAHFLGFMTIFVVVFGAGLTASYMLSKLAKGPIMLLNNVLGGFFGLLTGLLVCGVIVFTLSVFPINKKALKESRLSLFSLRITKIAVSLVPRELREKFKETYQDITKKVGKDGKEI